MRKLLAGVAREEGPLDHELPTVLAIAIPLALVAGPLLMAFIGWRGMRGRPRRDQYRPRFRHLALSAITFTLAYNLAFFWQELWLVLPKAMVPGLTPVLYHNNHTWEGEAAIASLFQGTGALALILTALFLLLVLRNAPPRRAAPRLFLAWGVLLAMMQGLLQLPIAVIDPGTDVGQAFDYLGWSETVRVALALLALAMLPIIARACAPHFLAIGPQPVSHPTRRIWWTAAVPALFGIGMTVAFRWPGSLDQLVVSPAIASAIGIGWMAALCWSVRPRAPVPGARTASFPWRWMGALVALLAFFQLVLAPGVAF